MEGDQPLQHLAVGVAQGAVHCHQSIQGLHDGNLFPELCQPQSGLTAHQAATHYHGPVSAGNPAREDVGGGTDRRSLSQRENLGGGPGSNHHCVVAVRSQLCIHRGAEMDGDFQPFQLAFIPADQRQLVLLERGRSGSQQIAAQLI